MVSEDQPLVMGHEASGIVHSVGPGVKSVVPGDRVAIEPGFSCRRCKQCKAGKYNLCPDMRFAADPPDNHGTLARLFRTPEDFVYKIPDTVSLEEGVLVEPLSVAVHGARLAGLSPGQKVLVQGSGLLVSLPLQRRGHSVQRRSSCRTLTKPSWILRGSLLAARRSYRILIPHHRKKPLE